MGKSAILAALCALAAVASASRALADCKLVKLAELPVTMTRSAAPVIDAKINGKEVRLIADSGAFFSMISPESARRLGLRPGAAPFGLHVIGVGGEADVKLVTASHFTLLNNDFPNTNFLVGEANQDPQIDGFVGQNLLNFLDVEYDLANGVIRLFKSEGCGGKALAYWATNQSYSVTHLAPIEPGSRAITTSALVNGVTIRVKLDTGAWRSILTTRAAALAGVKPDMPGARPAGETGGIGRRAVPTWIAPFDSFAIGDEQIKNTRLRIGAVDLEDSDMLLGADFFLSHRIFVANSRRKLYFTYNGGPVFRLDQASPPGRPSADAASPTSPASPPPSSGPASAEPTADEPKDADSFGRRGAAAMARRDFAEAIIDFGRAADLAPNEASYVFDRGTARLASGQPFIAMADFDQAIKLKPDYAQALMQRAALRLSGRDLPGAKVDFDAAVRADPRLGLDVALAYDRADQRDEAIVRLGQWIDANPGDERMAMALNYRCRNRALLARDLDQALADCNAANKLRPHTASFLDSRGLVHFRLGQFDAAIADYDEALKLQPKNASSLYGRGLAELKKGMKAEGEADLQASVTLAPRVADQAKRYGLAP